MLGKHEIEYAHLWFAQVVFSWQKRGHTSLLATGAVCEAETCLVLDYETISKFCENCTKKENAK